VSLGNREYWLDIDSRCQPVTVDDLVVIQHVVNLDWVYTAKVRQVRSTYTVVIGIDEELNSPANWKVRCKL
jgi:hypothetical protein